MKTLLLSIAALAVAASSVFGEDQNDKHKQKQRNQEAPKQQQQQHPQRQVNNVPRSYTPRVQQNLTNKTQALQNSNPNLNRQTWAQKKTYYPSTENKWQQNNSWNRNRPPADVVTTETNTNTTVQNNNNRNRNWSQNYNNNTNNRDRNWSQNNTNNYNRNRNWDWNRNSTNFTFEQARRHHRHDRHDRSWWRSHFSRIALFAGGYYYWNDGYWYPAYGYDPYYSTYTYDEPIYAYNDLQPGDVIVNVQTALQEQGYYNDEIDGLIGPNTRAALRNFQADHRLPMTASIDGPTLQALGL
jgi:hypothetical protein